MNKSESRVTLILSASGGHRAVEEAERGPIWLIESAENNVAAQKLRAEYVDRGDYITVFDARDEPAESTLSRLFYDIDLHHPAMTELMVIGAELTSAIKSVLGEGAYRETEDGFLFSPAET